MYFCVRCRLGRVLWVLMMCVLVCEMRLMKMWVVVVVFESSCRKFSVVCLVVSSVWVLVWIL